VALLADEPAAAEVQDLLREGVEMAAVNLAEALDVLGRVEGIPAERLRAVVAPLLAGPVTVVSVNARHAFRAAEIRHRHYHRRRSPLSLADCLALAACGRGRILATADPDMAAAARAEGIRVIGLPDRRGERPSAPSP
jgi:predicted nucleic acid-binding protein